MIDVIIGSMKADIVDRKWDTQGSVSMKEVAILDYITTGALSSLLDTRLLCLSLLFMRCLQSRGHSLSLWAIDLGQKFADASSTS